MAARGTRNKPKARKGGEGDNSLPAGEEAALIKRMLDNIKTHKLKKAAFATKMKKNWDTDIVAIAKTLNMAMGDVMAEYEDHAIETGDDKDAVEKAERKRARRLDTTRRIHAATHDGEQLDFLVMQKKAEEAIKQAEAEADAPTISEDDDE